MTHPDDRLLRIALRANATFSTGCALVAGLGGAPLAAALGIPAPAFLPGLALNLLGFAAFLAWFSTRERMAPAIGWTVVVLDLLWVVGTLPVVAGGTLTRTGNAVALAVAAVVGLWAGLQAAGLRRIAARTASAG